MELPGGGEILRAWQYGPAVAALCAVHSRICMIYAASPYV